MASITSLSNSSYNTSSIYGNRNVLSGLASGMDTESMIENAVSGIKTKIQNLTKKRTKIEWQQDAYRSIIDKAVNFNTKYTSYSSKTNLLSQSFFTNAVNTAVLGTYKDKITASGKTTSDIKINAVKQMAKAASYTVSGAALGLGSGLAAAEEGEAPGIRGELFDLSKQLDINNMSGSLTFQYGGTNGTTFDIKFDELENLDEMEGSSNAEKLANAINKKLSEITYSYTKNGFQETTTADKAIKVTANADGRITFSDGLGNGNSVKISSSSGKIKAYAGENVLAVENNLTTKKSTYEYLAGKQDSTGKWSGGKTLTVNLNGTSKTISMSDVMNNVDLTYDNASGKSKEKQFADALQGEIDKAFGKGKISVDWWDLSDNPDPEDGRLNLTPAKEGDTLSVSGSAVKALGFEDNSTNYINTGKKLSDLMGKDIFSDKNKLAAVGDVTLSSNGKYSVDEAGNRVSMGDDGKYYRVNSDGEFLYDFKINGANINVTKDTTLEKLMNSINSNAEAGVKVSYSKLTNEFKFTATETGANGKIEFGGLAKDMFTVPESSKSDKFADVYGLDLTAENPKRIYFNSPKVNISFGIDDTTTLDDVAEHLNNVVGSAGYEVSVNKLSGQLDVVDRYGNSVNFSFAAKNDDGDQEKLEAKTAASFTAGQDAIMDVEINGKRFENFTRSSNSFDIDGLTVNVKGTFEAKGKDGEDYEPITFNTTTDTDKIIDAIREFVNDYNEMATELKSAYSTLPAQKSNGARYEPLTAEEEERYSKTELEAYNEKAKQGILFGDTTLSSMYSKLLSAIAPGGADGQTLREIGIGTSYNNGMTTLSLDEDKLRAALESNPDKVKDAFTKTREGGSSTDGLMQTLQNTLNTYVKTTGEPKGVLIQRAGSNKAYTSLNSNSLKSQMDSIDSQIERWQTKMSNQIDRYTTQFSKLEQLIAQMNSQSSAFAGLMGGDSGY
ncbi:MAG: flagellar filament capping protein FliD [Oscillospiraceae bacterium]|nr:flagellar filament capping protein FliD [Oscillospiraceae bacterium]